MDVAGRKYICWAGSVALRGVDVWSVWSNVQEASKILLKIKPGETLKYLWAASLSWQDG